MEKRSKQDYKKYYNIIDVIGTGAFAVVYKAKSKETGEDRAIKVMNLNKIREEFMNKYNREEIEKQIKICVKGFITEFNNMKICINNNINSVKCYEYFNNEDYFAIIMELCDSDLSKLLLKKKKYKFNKEEIFDIMRQLNNTFTIMKENNILHRDLKLENILYNGDEKKRIYKITDYGSSKRLILLTINCKTNLGTPLYMAPEILEGR